MHSPSLQIHTAGVVRSTNETSISWKRGKWSSSRLVTANVRHILLSNVLCKFQFIYSFTFNPTKLNSVTCSIRVLFIMRSGITFSTMTLLCPWNIIKRQQNSGCHLVTYRSYKSWIKVGLGIRLFYHSNGRRVAAAFNILSTFGQITLKLFKQWKLHIITAW